MVCAVRPWFVTVDGFSPVLIVAGSRGKALAEAWQQYRICDERSFGAFLKIARVRLADPPEGFGEPITVAGQPAFRVGTHLQYVRFVRPDSDVILLSHPADVRLAA